MVIIVKANTASRTAQYMAFFRAIETVRHPHKRLFADPYAIYFLNNRFKRVVRIAALPLFGTLIQKIINRKGVGALSSGIARTKLIDELLQQTISYGVRQVIILGAGFDTRALRLDFLNATPVIEVDHPDTSDVKVKKLKEFLGRLPSNIYYYQIDFNKQSLADLAGRNNFNLSIPTTVIWEGVTNYLTQEAVDATFEFVEKLARGSYIIFTYVNKHVLENPQSFEGAVKLLRILSEIDEPWTFGLKPEELSDYLTKFSLTLLKDLGASQYRNIYMPDRKELLKGYDYYRVAFATRQE
ncbi:MAG: class I SAM-dependent methyltransferase [Syntrophales bacterium]